MRQSVRGRRLPRRGLLVPEPGTILAFVDGIFDHRQGQHQILLRGADDIVTGTPPAAVDAFPIFDNDLSGSDRRDSVMVVFDRAVEKTSAENVANYSLASLGAIDGAQRLDAPDDNRVVLLIRNQQPDGFSEAITVNGVRSLEDEAPMLAPQTLRFFNGVHRAGQGRRAGSRWARERGRLRGPLALSDPGRLAGQPGLVHRHGDRSLRR